LGNNIGKKGVCGVKISVSKKGKKYFRMRGEGMDNMVVDINNIIIMG
jgi:hypothetical protein